MREVLTSDFETANIQYIKFWIMDPFVENPDHSGGDLYINLGNISEDILRDSRKSFENGLPGSPVAKNVDTTAWGRVPTVQAVVHAFDNAPESRFYQDVGLDGLKDQDEQTFFADYLQKSIGLSLPLKHTSRYCRIRRMTIFTTSEDLIMIISSWEYLTGIKNITVRKETLRHRKCRLNPTRQQDPHYPIWRI